MKTELLCNDALPGVEPMAKAPRCRTCKCWPTGVCLYPSGGCKSQVANSKPAFGAVLDRNPAKCELSLHSLTPKSPEQVDCEYLYPYSTKLENGSWETWLRRMRLDRQGTLAKLRSLYPQVQTTY
jgi:hypothetical protein